MDEQTKNWASDVRQPTQPTLSDVEILLMQGKIEANYTRLMNAAMISEPNQTVTEAGRFSFAQMVAVMDSFAESLEPLQDETISQIKDNIKEFIADYQGGKGKQHLYSSNLTAMPSNGLILKNYFYHAVEEVLKQDVQRQQSQGAQNYME